jgi:imidazolonepropionase
LTLFQPSLALMTSPSEYKCKTNDYVDLIIEKMIPEIKKQDLAEYCDVFCENGYFDDKQTTKILKAAKKLKFKVRFYADEFEDSKGAETFARLKIHSADHLMAVSDHGIDRLSFKKCVATMLPGPLFSLARMVSPQLERCSIVILELPSVLITTQVLASSTVSP